MTPQDTELGGAGRAAFPDTRMSLIARLRDPSTRELRSTLEALARDYWKPAYGFIRAARQKSNDDAKDLVQSFFLWLAEGNALRQYDPDRGRFRPWLKVVLRRFLNDQDKALAALKRGGGATLLDAAALAEALPDPRTPDPERAFDRAWAAALLERAVARVRTRCSENGTDLRFRAFEAHDLHRSGSYSEVATRLGVKESDVRNWLHGVREAVRKEVRAELSGSAADERELEEEWRDFLAV